MPYKASHTKVQTVKKEKKKNAKRTYKPRDRKTKKVKKHERKKDMGKEQRLKREI